MEPLRLETISPAVINDDSARNWFHTLCLLIFETKPGHIRNHLKPKGFLTMVEPLIINVVVGTAHQRGKCVKNPLPYNAVIYPQEGVEVEPDLETLKGVLEGCVAVDVLETFLVSGKSLGIEIIQLGLTVVVVPDIIYSAHNLK